MKKIMWVQLIVIVLIGLTAATSTSMKNEKEMIADLMAKRIGILSYYYGGKMTFDDARANMEKISKGSLFKEDVALMKGLGSTEVDQITDYDIEVLSCKTSNYGILQGQIKVSWMMHGHEGHWNTEETYYFTAEVDLDKVKLTQLKKL